jgi:TnpA family transposase
MLASNKQLTILSEAERAALYEQPDFDDEQRFTYLTLTDKELQVVLSRKSLSTKVYCALQIGYFKAVKLFFQVFWDDIDCEDIHFILQQYFLEQDLEEPEIISKHEYYTQCNAIVALFEYSMWSREHQSLLYDYAPAIICRDIKPQFIALELISYLGSQKIIRPGYTTLQLIISNIINEEQKRLATIIQKSLTDNEKKSLQSLLINDDTLSKLAALKQDAKDFKPRMMANERNKLNMLRPFYRLIIRILPELKLSQQNIFYYASLINYYTSHDLRTKIKTEQAYIYILCYAWQRYQQINDNLVNAFCYHVKQFKDKTKDNGKRKFAQHMVGKHKTLGTMKSLVRLYVDDDLSDELHFGDIRKKAFTIIPKDELLETVFNQGSQQEIDFYWQEFDKVSRRVTINLRPLAMILDFDSTNKNNQWLQALQWMKPIFAKQQRLTKLDDCPENTIPKRLLPYLIDTDENGNKKPNTNRYEFWIYRQLASQFHDGYIFLNDSLQYRSLEQELTSADKVNEYIAQLNMRVLTTPIEQQLKELFAILDEQWRKFDKLLREDKIKHLRYDAKTKTLHLRKPKTDKEEEIQNRFYEQLPLRDIADVLRFVDEDCSFLSACTHIQPRYAKQPLNKDHLIATIIAQGMNNGNLNMAAISDIPYKSLHDTLQSRIRLATLKDANDIISNTIAKMPIFELYSFDMSVLYGGVDGQKFGVEKPTIKARHSRKHFGKGKGVVAYTLLANHIPLQVYLIGAHQHESNFAFDIWYNNTTDIVPDALTGDMHCMNRINFILMHCFDGKLYPRFTNIEDQRRHLYCGYDSSEYKDFIIKPVGQLTGESIIEAWLELQQIIVTLAIKESTQSTIVRKLSTYPPEHKIYKALIEFDNIIRSIYTLNYFIDPDIHKNVHRSQNRVESYHQLRAAIAEAYGKKQLLGKTDIEVEISNECGRLLANTISYYNSAILSKLLVKYKAENNQKGIAILRKISPIAKQHIHFQGHLSFANVKAIDLDEIIKQLILEY